MRKAALIVSIASLAAVSVAFAATRGDAARPAFGQALVRTARAPWQHYALNVRITKAGSPRLLHVHGQASERTISVHLTMSDVTLPDGTKVPGPDAAALLDGAFLYERAPSSIAVLGIRWLRMPLASLSAGSPELKALHALTPLPLLRLLGEANMVPAKNGARFFRGNVAYDNPVVRESLSRLTGGVEFRNLRVSVYLGADGLVHRFRVTGRTADGTSTLSLGVHLFAFGRPVHVTLPAPGTFLDEELSRLSA